MQHNKNLLASTGSQDLVDKVGERNWVNLVGGDGVRQHRKHLVDDADAALAERLTHVDLIEEEEFGQERLGQKLEENCL